MSELPKGIYVGQFWVDKASGLTVQIIDIELFGGMVTIKYGSMPDRAPSTISLMQLTWSYRVDSSQPNLVSK